MTRKGLIRRKQNNQPTIQFSISTHLGSIWPLDRPLSDATTLGQSGPKGDGNEGVLNDNTWTHLTVCKQ